MTKIACASTIIVGPPPASIQNAINSASNGDTIQLSAGTYVQEVQVISKSINIVGAGRDVTFIQAPPPATHLTQFFNFGFNTYCIVMVDNQAAPAAQNVNISDLTVDGDSQQDTIIPPIYSSGNKFYAIGYHNAGGTIQNVHTTNTRATSPGFLGSLAGAGISNASNLGSVTFNVVNSFIDFYQRIGMDLRGAALTANVTGTTISRGYTVSPATGATPNGVQFSNSTMGSITNSIIEGNTSTFVGSGQAGSGIMVFAAAPNILVSGNTIRNNDNGISGLNANNNLTIANNLVEFTTSPGVNGNEGIIIINTNGSTIINSNTIKNIPGIGIDLLSTTNQFFQLANNEIIRGQTGLLVQGNLALTFFFLNLDPEDPFTLPTPTATALGPVVTMNSDSFSGTAGYYIQENGAPNDIWPSTASVSFDGVISGRITAAQFQYLLTKIFDKHNQITLGLVLDFIPPPAPPSNFIGVVKKSVFLNKTRYVLNATWSPSPSPGVISYRIFQNGVLIQEVPVGSSLSFKICLDSQPVASSFTIVAFNANLESNPIQLILH